MIEPTQIQASAAMGRVFSYGAQVTSWSPLGSQDALFLSPQAVFETGSAIRGGIPVVFPWFGPGREPGMSPAHGFARTASWHLMRVQEDAGSVQLAYEITDADATSAWFPHPYRARLTVAIGAVLDVRLETTNTGTEAYTFEQALHAYLAVGDVRQVRLRGLDAAAYLDKVDGDRLHRQTGDVRFSGPTDRIYRSAGDVLVVDPVLRRAIRIQKEHSAQTVVWNPWDVGAGALADLGPESWSGMLCIEPANVLDSSIELFPGRSHEMAMVVSIEALP